MSAITRPSLTNALSQDVTDLIARLINANLSSVSGSALAAPATSTTPDDAVISDEPVTANEDAPPGVSIMALNRGRTEGAERPAIIEISLEAPLRSPLTVLFDLDGTAAPDEDFVIDPFESVEIPAGETLAQAELTALSDLIPEGPESVLVRLREDPGYTIITPEPAELVIRDVQDAFGGPDVVSYWPIVFTDAGNVLDDITETDADGLFIGDPQIANGGLVGPALTLDGTMDGAGVRHGEEFELDLGTLVIWFKEDLPEPDAENPERPLAAKIVGGNEDLFTLAITPEDSLQARFETSEDTATVTGGEITKGEWQQAVVTWDGTRAVLYLNGEEVAATPFTGSLATNTNDFLFGTDGDEGFFSGQIDEISLFSAPLNRLEVLALFDQTGSGEGLMQPDIPNQPPIAVLDEGVLTETGSISFDPLANDEDPEGLPLRLTAVNGERVQVGDVVTLPAGSLVAVSDEGLTYDPNGIFDAIPEGSSEPAVFTYTVTDTEGLSAQGTVELTVLGENTAPVAQNDFFTTDEKDRIAVDPRENDADVDGTDLRIVRIGEDTIAPGSHVTLPSGAIIGQEEDGRLTYDTGGAFDFLAEGDLGNDAFDYTIADEFGAEDTANVAITINGENDAPVANDDSASTVESSGVIVDVLANDTDAEDQDLTIFSINGIEVEPTDRITLDSGATVRLRNDEQLRYNPQDQFNDLFARQFIEETFTYAVRDTQGGTDHATVSVRVDGEGALPFDFQAFYPVTNSPFPTLFDDSGNRNDGRLVNGTEVVPGIAGDGLRFDGVDDYALIENSTDFDLSDGAISFWFNPAQNGQTQTLLSRNAFGVNDGDLDISFTADQAIQVRLQGEDRSRVAETGPLSLNEWHHVAVNFGEGSGLEIWVDGVLEEQRRGVDIGIAGNANPITIGAGQALSTEGEADNLVQFYKGLIDDISIHPEALSEQDIAIIRDFGAAGIELLGTDNREPDAGADFASVAKNATVVIDVLANDSDPNRDTLGVVAVDGTAIASGETVALSSGALVTLQADNTLLYDPNGQFDGLSGGDVDQDAFTYSAGDPGGLTDTATVTVTVEAAQVPGIVTYWPGDASDGNRLEDVSGNDIDGMLQGGARYTSNGLVGDALFLDGRNDVALVAHNDALLLDEGGVSLWFNADDNNGFQGLFSKDASFNGTGGHLDVRYLFGGTVVARIQSANGNDEAEISIGGFAPRQWNHVAVTWGEDGFQVYRNGELVEEDTNYTKGLGTSSGGAGNFEPIAIGATERFSNNLSSNPLREFFDGRIDEVAILGIQPTEETVRTLYERGLEGIGVDGSVDTLGTQSLVVDADLMV